MLQRTCRQVTDGSTAPNGENASGIWLQTVSNVTALIGYHFNWSFDNQFTATIHITAKMWSLAPYQRCRQTQVWTLAHSAGEDCQGSHYTLFFSLSALSYHFYMYLSSTHLSEFSLPLQFSTISHSPFVQ